MSAGFCRDDESEEWDASSEGKGYTKPDVNENDREVDMKT